MRTVGTRLIATGISIILMLGLYWQPAGAEPPDTQEEGQSQSGTGTGSLGGIDGGEGDGGIIPPPPNPLNDDSAGDGDGGGEPTEPPTGDGDGGGGPTEPPTGDGDGGGEPTEPPTGDGDGGGEPTEPPTGDGDGGGEPTEPSTGDGDGGGDPAEPPTGNGDGGGAGSGGSPEPDDEEDGDSTDPDDEDDEDDGETEPEDQAAVPAASPIAPMGHLSSIMKDVKLESIRTGRTDQFDASETIKITIILEHFGSIPDGEMTTITVPDSLSLLSTKDPISIKNENDNSRIMGYATIDPWANKIDLEATDASQNTVLVTGYITVSATINRNRLSVTTAGTHPETFVFTESSSDTCQVTADIVKTDYTGAYHMLYKYGSYTHNDQIEWYTQINHFAAENRNQLYDLKIIDKVGDGHEYISGSLQVFTYSSVTLIGNDMEYTHPLDITSRCTIVDTADGFEVSIPSLDELNLSGNEGYGGLTSIPYRLIYRTYVTDYIKGIYDNRAELTAINADWWATNSVAVQFGAGGTAQQVTLIVKKTDGVTHNELPGAEFAIVHKGEDNQEVQVATLVTGSDGIATYNGRLRLGTEYIIREIHTPGPQYKPAKLSKVTFEYAGQTITELIENFPEEQTAILEIRKVDEEGFRLSGAKFILFQDQALTVRVDDKYGNSVWTTGNSGQPGMARIEGLAVGRYYLMEIEAPAGYVRDSTVREVDVLGNASGVTAVTLTNKRDAFTLRILKEDKNNKQLLDGAEFTAYRKSPSGNWTEVDTFAIRDAQAGYTRQAIVGEYRLWENKAPEGYLLPNEYVEFTLTEQDKLYGSYTLIVSNTPRDVGNTNVASVRVYSHDEQDDAMALEGAELVLFRQENGGWTKMTEATTGNTGLSGVIGDLAYGTYKFEPIAEPQGYQAAVEEKRFDLTEENAGETPKVIPVPYRAHTATLEIVKYDMNTDALLPGAQFALQRQNGTDIFSNRITGPDGSIVVDNIPYGTYQLWEIDAPDGYYTAGGATEIVVDRDRVVIRVPNKPVDPDAVADVKLVKHEDGNRNILLAGAKFDLEVLNGDTWELYLHGYVTDAKGEINVHNLPFGTYRVIEKEAPAGYRIMSAHSLPQTLDNTIHTTLYIPNQKASTSGGSGGSDSGDSSSSSRSWWRGNGRIDTDPTGAATGDGQLPEAPPGYESGMDGMSFNPDTGSAAPPFQMLLGMALGCIVAGGALMLKARKKD